MAPREEKVRVGPKEIKDFARKTFKALRVLRRGALELEIAEGFQRAGSYVRELGALLDDLHLSAANIYHNLDPEKAGTPLFQASEDATDYLMELLPYLREFAELEANIHAHHLESIQKLTFVAYNLLGGQQWRTAAANGSEAARWGELVANALRHSLDAMKNQKFMNKEEEWKEEEDLVVVQPHDGEDEWILV